MRAPTTTRRSLLVAAAGGLAGGVIRSRPALAALATAPPQPRVSSRPLGSLARGRLLGVSLGAPADLIGVSWRGEPHARVEMRLREASGRFGAWVAAGARGHAPEGPARGSETIGDPVWTGGTSELQLRSDRPLERVRLHLVDVSGGIGARVRARRIALLATPLALATPALAAGAGQPPIIARRAWAHRAAPPKVAPEYGAVRLAFVHHTENPNGYGRGEVPSMLLAIYAFHRYVRGWDDIGYNFVIDRFGRIFEARAGGIDEPVSGAQAGGYNLESTGVAVLGSFQSVPISAHARNALQRLLAWKLSLHGVPAHGSVTVRVNPAGAVFSRFPAGAHVPLPRIAGHRDGDSTDCPGDALYGELPQIRRAVRRLAPTQARLTLLASAPAPADAVGAARAARRNSARLGAHPRPSTLRPPRGRSGRRANAGRSAHRCERRVVAARELRAAGAAEAVAARALPRRRCPRCLRVRSAAGRGRRRAGA